MKKVLLLILAIISISLNAQQIIRKQAKIIWDGDTTIIDSSGYYKTGILKFDAQIDTIGVEDSLRVGAIWLKAADIGNSYNRDSVCNYNVDSAIVDRAELGDTATALRSYVDANTEFSDDEFNIYNNADETKIANFDLSGITTGTTTTIQIGDDNIIMPSISSSEPSFAINTSDGIGSSGANNLSLITNGVSRMEINGSAININTASTFSATANHTSTLSVTNSFLNLVNTNQFFDKNKGLIWDSANDSIKIIGNETDELLEFYIQNTTIPVLQMYSDSIRMAGTVIINDTLQLPETIRGKVCELSSSASISVDFNTGCTNYELELAVSSTITISDIPDGIDCKISILLDGVRTITISGATLAYSSLQTMPTANDAEFELIFWKNGASGTIYYGIYRDN